MQRLASHALLFVVLLLVGGPRVLAADEVFLTQDGAIHGYDPVAYHLEGRAVRGNASIIHVWSGASWHFASEENRKRFVADPARYAPRYGGYCAYGTSRGYKVSTQPEAFAIVDGVLYLNHSMAVQRTWNRNTPGLIRAADARWSEIAHEAYSSDAATIAKQRSGNASRE